jgi:BlaI family transcriptional regulator, penicillinase repressor
VDAKNPPTSEAELAVLKVLWDLSQGTVREVRDVLLDQDRDWAYTTVQTLLNRLEAKGHVRVERSGTVNVYRPAVSREQFAQQRLGELAEDLYEGAASSLVLALVEGTRFTAAELEQFRKLLEQLEQEPPRRKK